MKRGFAFLAVAGVFVSGALVGGLSTHLLYAQRVHAGGHPLPFLGRHYAETLERKLELSAAQSREITQILEQSHREAETLRRQVRPRLEQLMDQTRDRVRGVLTPEQQERFDHLPPSRFHGPRGHRHGEQHGPPEEGRRRARDQP